MPEQERWLSIEEIAAQVGVNRNTIDKWIDRKRMPARKLGRRRKFKASRGMHGGRRTRPTGER